MTGRSRWWLAGLLWLPTAVLADVSYSTDSSFTVQSDALVSRNPEEVYRVLTEQVAQWWSPDHTWSGHSENLSIDARAGGCFCEQLEVGGSVMHLMVVKARPGEELKMRGALGPLQDLPVVGVQHWVLKLTEAGKTRVSVSYSVSGVVEGGLTTWAAAVDGVLVAQLTRLQRLLETGKPE